jgi:copper(I)-binding protein
MILVAGLLALAAAAAETTVTEPWVRGTVAAQKSTGAYMKLKSSEDAKLVAVSSPDAKSVEIHEMAMKGSVMEMREVGALALPAGKTVELKPGGYHLMLMDLAKPLAKGQTVMFTLTLEDKAGKRTKFEFSAEVRALASGQGGHGH